MNFTSSSIRSLTIMDADKNPYHSETKRKLKWHQTLAGNTLNSKKQEKFSGICTRISAISQ